MLQIVRSDLAVLLLMWLMMMSLEDFLIEDWDLHSLYRDMMQMPKLKMMRVARVEADDSRMRLGYMSLVVHVVELRSVLVVELVSYYCLSSLLHRVGEGVPVCRRNLENRLHRVLGLVMTLLRMVELSVYGPVYEGVRTEQHTQLQLYLALDFPLPVVLAV